MGWQKLPVLLLLAIRCRWAYLHILCPLVDWLKNGSFVIFPSLCVMMKLRWLPTKKHKPICLLSTSSIHVVSVYLFFLIKILTKIFCTCLWPRRACHPIDILWSTLVCCPSRDWRHLKRQRLTYRAWCFVPRSDQESRTHNDQQSKRFWSWLVHWFFQRFLNKLIQDFRNDIMETNVKFLFIF